MVSPKDFFDALAQQNVTNFSGVPDSLLKNVCAYISDNAPNENHLITANEGSAVALAVGQYLATGKPSLVYMQNSGFGNAINPLLSLADEQVYGIPMIVLIGWRGEPGVKDEPQHIKQGDVMEEILAACDLPYEIIDQSVEDISGVIKRNVNLANTKQSPVVLLVKKGTFTAYKLQNTLADISDLSREDAIRKVISATDEGDVCVSTTGMPSRELFEIRVSNHQSHERDFLTVGSMGHANMIALGVAQASPSRHVFCLDGDGASVMHLGNLTSVGQSGAKNFIHILLNNAAHDSVGGQPTCANHIDLPSIAKSCGYQSALSINNVADILDIIARLKASPGPHFIEIKVKKGARTDLGRPTSTPSQNKEALMNYLVR
jgi:phosphonopyruvate decarboxylase